MDGRQTIVLYLHPNPRICGYFILYAKWGMAYLLFSADKIMIANQLTLKIDYFVLSMWPQCDPKGL